MRLAPMIICLTLSILGCSQNGTLRSPTAATPPMATPPPPPSNMVAVWGIVVDPSGECIEGASVEVVGGPALLGQTATQTTPCDVTQFSGGFEFADVPMADWDEMILRASAPGYVSREQPAGIPWDQVLTFTLVPTGL